MVLSWSQPTDGTAQMEAHDSVPGRRNPRFECRVQHNHTLKTASDVFRFQSHLPKNGFVIVSTEIMLPLALRDNTAKSIPQMK